MDSTIVVKFRKLHGLGNDYVFIEDPDQLLLNRLQSIIIGNQNSDQSSVSALHLLIRRLSDRKGFGIGSDGVIFRLKSEKANIRMRMFNSNGLESENCGNGLRCLARDWFDQNPSQTFVSIETKAGIFNCHKVSSSEVKINMGKPRAFRGLSEIVHQESVQVGLSRFSVHLTSMGNPHCVIFQEEFPLEWPVLGSQIEVHPRFQPEKTNVEFIKVISNSHLQMKVWERASGVTQACGTGAVSAAVVAIFLKKVSSNGPVKVSLDGGDLYVQWDGNPESDIWMIGPTHFVFRGEFVISDLLPELGSAQEQKEAPLSSTTSEKKKFNGPKNEKPNLLLGLSGSVASVKALPLAEQLSQIGNLIVVPTKHSEHFFSRAELQKRLPEVQVYEDCDEWDMWGKLSDDVLHIELRKWADILLVAPLDANTLSKIYYGQSNNLLTCVIRAWEFPKPLIVAPAMNTLMWQNPLTIKQVKRFPERLPLSSVIPPISKKLACNDIGFGAMASVEAILETVLKMMPRAMLVRKFHEKQNILHIDPDLGLLADRLHKLHPSMEQLRTQDLKEMINVLVQTGYAFIKEGDVAYTPYPQSKLQ